MPFGRCDRSARIDWTASSTQVIAIRRIGETLRRLQNPFQGLYQMESRASLDALQSYVDLEEPIRKRGVSER